MQQSVEKIIGELYEIDPTLREREADIRALVTVLTESKPALVVNAVFLEKLRTDLLWRVEGSRRAKKTRVVSPFLWWLVRLAPLGAFAVLMFMLYPQHTESPTTAPIYIDTYERTQPESADTDQTFKSMIAEPAANEGQMQSPFVLESVTLPRSGFAVFETLSGEVVGVSKLLPPGTTVGVYISLTRSIGINDSFSTVLYLDNGDGVYTEKDSLLTQ